MVTGFWYMQIKRQFINISWNAALKAVVLVVFVQMVFCSLCFARVGDDGGSNTKGIDPSVLELVRRIAANPELMNLTYLQYLIGLPENGRNQAALLKRNYNWYEEPSRVPVYHLDQIGPQPGVTTSSTFTINVPASNIRVKDVEQVFGTPHTRVYDHQAHPNQIYRYSPTTSLVFVEPRNSFRVTSIKILYNGPPLGEPSQEDLERAYNFRKSQAYLAGQNGDWQQAIPWLRADVAKNPQDADAHLKLAYAYRQHLMINESIQEYVQVLKLCGGRPDLQSAAVAGLTEMRVWPAPLPGSQPASGRTYVAGAGSAGQPGL